MGAGLPWDEKQSYRMDTIEVYFETNMTKPLDPGVKVVETKQKFKKCELNSKLIDVLRDELYIIPQFPAFYVVAKGTPFYASFLSNQS